jgi:sigma-B regulation protein RsbU (phosphoserine phosphatase)
LAHARGSPAQTLQRLNDALASDNPSAMFVTLLHGVYDPVTGDIVVACGGHPAPLIHRSDGQVQEVPIKNGRVLGSLIEDVGLVDSRLHLEKGETLILYTDGFTEAVAPGSQDQFGLDRLRATLGGVPTDGSLESSSEKTKEEVLKFIGTTEMQDDMTILLMRRE